MVTAPAFVFLPRERLDALIDLLHEGGRQIIGPTVRDGMLELGEIRAATDLPIGWTDEQAPGRYRLAHGTSERAFDVVNGQMSWKQFTFPPQATGGDGQEG